MNVTFAALFPDLHGAAQQANFETVNLALLILSYPFRRGYPDVPLAPKKTSTEGGEGTAE